MLDGEIRLTPREREVVKLLAVGCSQKVIGRRLGIARGTVAMHVQRAADKLPGDTPPTHRILCWWFRQTA